MAFTRMFCAAEIGRQVAHRRLQRRLGHAHDVVVRRPVLGAEIGQGQQRRAGAHHRHRALRHRDEGVAGDVQRLQERGARRVQVAAAQILLVGIGDGVHQEVQPVPAPLQGGEGGVDAGLVGDVAGNSRSDPTEAASGRTRRSSASPWKVKASSAPCAAQAAAMPQPSERSLATPMIRPRLPCIREPVILCRAGALSGIWVLGFALVPGADVQGRATRRVSLCSVVAHGWRNGQGDCGRLRRHHADGRGANRRNTAAGSAQPRRSLVIWHRSCGTRPGGECP